MNSECIWLQSSCHITSVLALPIVLYKAELGKVVEF